MTYFLSDTLHRLEVADDEFYPSARDLPDPIGEVGTKRRKGGEEKGVQTLSQLSEHDKGIVLECKLGPATHAEAGEVVFKAASRSSRPKTLCNCPCPLGPPHLLCPPLRPQTHKKKRQGNHPKRQQTDNHQPTLTNSALQIFLTNQFCLALLNFQTMVGSCLF